MKRRVNDLTARSTPLNSLAGVTNASVASTSPVIDLTSVQALQIENYRRNTIDRLPLSLLGDTVRTAIVNCIVHRFNWCLIDSPIND